MVEAKETSAKRTVSRIRKVYIARLVIRCIVLILGFILCFTAPELFYIVDGNFFARPTLLHILWFVWMLDMVYQLFPIRTEIALGSHKLFQYRFRPLLTKTNYEALRKYTVFANKGAYKVFLIWAALLLVLFGLHHNGILGNLGLFMVSLTFYVCDLICVLVWCPFRLIMKNRCCTTCRIFNWDHLMMFTPMMFIGSFFSYSLLITAILVWLLWEINVLLFPERFWEITNTALRCSECTDKLCTQYCQKLRKR